MITSDSFLHLLTKELLSLPTPLEQQLIILPTKRACTFLEQIIIERMNGEPVILPKIITIDEWITKMCDLTIAEHTTTVCYLYNLYAALQEKRGTKQTAEQLINLSQSERMLSDFQDIDLAMVDVSRLFQNIEHLDEYDDFSHLEPHEVEALLKFWQMLDRSQLEEHHSLSAPKDYLSYTDTWQQLYHQLSETLSAQGLTYRGAAYRYVAESDEITPEVMLQKTQRMCGFQLEYVCFAGLYNLTQAERACIKKIKSGTVTVDFYWEKLRIPAFEELNAPIIESKNILGGKYLSPETLLSSPTVKLISANSTIIQPAIVNQILKEIVAQDQTAIEELRVAVVLNNEQTLIPLLDSLSLPIGSSVNVTMGYPIQHSAIATWIRRYLDCFVGIETVRPHTKLHSQRLLAWAASPHTLRLLGSERTSALQTLLQGHSYTITVEELEAEAHSYLLPPQDGQSLLGSIEKMLRSIREQDVQTRGNDTDESSYRQDLIIEIECIDHLLQYVLKISGIVGDNGNLNNRLHATYLLEQLISVGTVPYEGDPLMGLQVMGFLETRSLTFDYVIMLNVQEGSLPKSTITTTLIPDLLRRAYQLKTYQEDDKTNAYHFYRLFNGAKTIYLLQDIRPKSVMPVTRSRYIDQIYYLTDYLTVEEVYSPTVEAVAQEDTSPTSHTPEVSRYLEAISTSPIDNPERAPQFSPSDLICFYRCPYSFYLKKILQIGEPPIEQGVLTEIVAGNIVHAVLKQIYDQAPSDAAGERKVITEEFLSKLLDRRFEPTIKHIIRTQYQEELKATHRGLSAMEEIQIDNLLRFVKKAFRIDLELLSQYSIEILDSETSIKDLALTFGADPCRTLWFRGTPDRVDLLTRRDDGLETYRIVDYKTGHITWKKADGEDGRSLSSSNLEAWRERASEAKLGEYLLQSGLYALIYTEHREQMGRALPHDKRWQPTLYSLAPQNPPDKSYINYAPATLDQLRELVSPFILQLFDPTTPYRKTSEEKLCTYCDFKSICNRSGKVY